MAARLVGSSRRELILFFIDSSSQGMKIAGIGSQANGLWMSQIGRNQGDPVDDLFGGKRYLIHDRDLLFTAEFLEMLLANIGIQSVKLPPCSPKLVQQLECQLATAN